MKNGGLCGELPKTKPRIVGITKEGRDLAAVQKKRNPVTEFTLHMKGGWGVGVLGGGVSLDGAWKKERVDTLKGWRGIITGPST